MPHLRGLETPDRRLARIRRERELAGGERTFDVSDLLTRLSPGSLVEGRRPDDFLDPTGEGGGGSAATGWTAAAARTRTSGGGGPAWSRSGPTVVPDGVISVHLRASRRRSQI